MSGGEFDWGGRLRKGIGDVERHTVVEIIAHIGHTEEMYQMVLAVINQ